MFDVGFWEILFILVLALVVIGPERLPGAARKAGFFIGKARRYIEGVRSEVESELDVGEFKRMLHNQEVQINELQQQLKAGADDISAGVQADVNTDIITDVPSHSFHDREEDDDEDETSYGDDDDDSTDVKPAAATATAKIAATATEAAITEEASGKKDEEASDKDGKA